MPPLIDLVGMKFGRLKVLRRVANKGREPTWECICECGNMHRALGRNLRTGSTKSCGCYNREQPRTHGESGTRLYSAWKGIINRCNGFTEQTKSIYKDKGITVCERWRSFENFQEDMKESFEAHSEIHGESDTTLDRINGEKGYYPENCRWATHKVQARNRKFRNKHPGVALKKGRWKANIGVNGSQIHLGTFETQEDAVEARIKAEEKYWEEC